MYGPIVPGPRLRLRPPRKADAPDWLAWRTDPDVSRFAWPISAGAPTLEQVEHNLAEMTAATDRVVWIVETSGRAIGLTFLFRIDWVARHAYHGYAIGDRSLWGKGLASEASSLAVRFGFHDLRLNKIKAEVASPHLPSQRVLEKGGFRRVGVFQNELSLGDAGPGDMIWFDLLRGDWLARARPEG